MTKHPGIGHAETLSNARISRRQALAGGAVATVAGAALAAAHQPQAAAATPGKREENLGMPWEAAYGYSQAVQVGDTIYLSGQLSHDAEGGMVAPAPLDPDGRIADHGNMGPQMAQAYANAKVLLERFGASLANVVEEVVYVTDMDAAFAVAGEVRAEAYGGRPVVASTILVTPRLAFREQLIEIRMVARV
jgi:enamine deaminase RidA (YjgF/YER057c/UK114 family)